MGEHAIEDWPGDWQWTRAGGKGRGRRHPRPDDLERIIALRHLRGAPFGRGAGFGGGGPFGGGRGRRRRGDVRLALLMLLAEEPRNGYQLMQTIEERSDGRWRPSPGSVYPTLAQLEDEGFVRSVEHESAKRFELTEAGREHLTERGEVTAPWDDRDDQDDEDVSMRGQIAQLARAAIQVVQVGDESQVKRASETLAEARRSLYRILAEETDA